MLNSKSTLVGFCLLCATVSAAAQHCHLALRGYIRESPNNEVLAYATVFVAEAGRGAITDESGYFSIADLCENTTYTVEVSHVTYAHFTQIIRLTENTTIDFRLVHDALLKEVIILEKAVAPAPTQTQNVVEHAELEAARGLGLTETLKKIPGVTMLSSGGTISKPVIQGLHGNRIAIVSDGVTLQSQQWGNDHAPEIDPYAADVIKVIKGAAGVRYGVGAMAGAVVLEPAPLRDQVGANGWASLSAFSNGYGGAAAALVDWKPKRGPFSWRMQGTLKRGGNLRAPAYWLGNTGAAELNFSTTVGWKKNRWKQTLSVTQFAQSFGILRAAHTGSISDLDSAITSERPRNNLDYFSYSIDRPSQRVQHNTLKYKAEWQITDLWKLTGQYSFQYNQRREYDRARNNTTSANKAQVAFQLWSNTLDVALEHLPVRHFQGGVGVQAMQQLNYVSKGGFIPDFMGWGGSVWAMERWRRYPVPWEFEAGLRFDYRWNHVTTTGNGNNDLNKRLAFGNVSGSAGVIYHVSPAFTLRTNTGYAWRPPNVNELFARGVHHGAGRYEQGNPGLQSEKAWNTNLTLEWETKAINVVASVYRNQVQDFIFLNQPRDSTVLTIRGPFPAYFYEQADAVLQGLDAQISTKIAAGFSVEGRLSIIRGYQLAFVEGRKIHDWLPLLPVDRFQYGLKWTLNRDKTKNKNTGAAGETFIRLMASTALQQTRIPVEGLTKAAPDTFTLYSFEAAHTFHFGARRTGNTNERAHALELGLNIQNLTNVSYREYLDLFRYFADMPGLNIGLRAKYTFGT
jgi:iron complex outermembrane receptor protein